MRNIMADLLVLQKLQFEARGRTAAPPAEVERLRAQIPPPILAHYERLVLRGKKGVALARNGVCCGCHLGITRGKLVKLSTTSEVHKCDNCGCYLYLTEGEPAAGSEAKPLVAPPAPPAKRRPRKALAHVL